jgi:hypothetical protein
MAGLISLACSSSGLKSRGSTAAGGGGGQADSTIGSGTTGGTVGTIATGGSGGASTGGAGSGAAGTIGAGGFGGAGAAGASGNTGGTGGCSHIDCHMPACAGEFQPNPDPCGCAVICVPNPDAGIAKDAGSPDFPAYCYLIDCGIERPCSSGYAPSTDPCGCPICAPADGGKPDGPPPCRIACPLLDCVGGYLPNPNPCTCPVCAALPDAGVAQAAQDAGTRTPLLHRSVGATCPAQRAPGPFTFGCNSVTCPAYLCVQDLNCMAGTNGRCLTGYPGGLALCSYDECFSDGDCPANIPCECRDSASSSAPNSCLAGSDCRVDSDCGPGAFCSPSPAWVGAPYHCHTSSDTCMDDSNCMPLKSCAFDGQNGYWSCVVLPPPPT